MSQTINEALQSIGWNAMELADQAGVHLRTAQRWKSEAMDMPPDVKSWVLDLAAYHDAHPCPQRVGDYT